MWNTWKEPLFNLAGVVLLVTFIMGAGMGLGLGFRYISTVIGL